MSYILSNATVYVGGALKRADVLVSGGHVSMVAPGLSSQGAQIIDLKGKFIFPGFVDVHVHLREPGFSYKETIKTGTAAAARGGYTAVCAMPNLSPVPDCPENLQAELNIISKDALISVYPYGAITRGEEGFELSDMEGLSPHVAAFSDDGRGVQSEEIMEAAMVKARSLGKIIAAHCEDEGLLKKGWSVNDGDASARLGLIGNPPESEWRQVERDIKLAEKTGCRYHVCHVSTRQSVELIRQAKSRGVDITCETAPHYLLLTDEEMQDSGAFRMNPPIRSRSDRDALISGVLDGTIDMIATDHAPHSPEEKFGGIASSLNGISGLECAFPVLYTKLVLGGSMTLERLIDMMSFKPARRFKLSGGYIVPGGPADLAVFDLDSFYTIDSGSFASMCRSTPFDGWRVRGRCVMTMRAGKIIWEEV